MSFPKDFMIMRINRKNQTCKVRDLKGNTYNCHLQDWLVNAVMHSDYVKIEKINGKWTVVDYHLNFEVYAGIHNSYQENYDDMVLNENGVPY